jgi:pimeloyl-ACP methyl ester carboxylesterase
MKVAVEGTMRRWLLLIMCLFMSAAAMPALAQGQRLEGVGVLLLHGKRAEPPDNLVGLQRALEAAGARVLVPEMSWSGRRSLSGTFEQAMTDIDEQVAQLRAQGARRIVIGGHGMGGNAALGYAARRRNLMAVMIVGPGHTPDRGALRRGAAADVERARRMIRAGGSDAVASFFDNYQGRPQPITTTANAYFSWFDPNGVAIMPRNARALRINPLPFLYLIGTRDPIFPLGSGYAFDIGNRNPSSRYISVPADRRGTPDAGAREVVSWLSGLPR